MRHDPASAAAAVTLRSLKMYGIPVHVERRFKRDRLVNGHARFTGGPHGAELAHRRVQMGVKVDVEVNGFR